MDVKTTTRLAAKASNSKFITVPLSRPNKVLIVASVATVPLP